MDPYRFYPFPDADFTCDEKAQQDLLAASQSKDKFLLRAFALMAVSFALAVAFGLLGLILLVLLGMATFAVTLVALLVRFFMNSPWRRKCRSCGRQMEPMFRELDDGDDAAYLICEPCRRYVYTYLKRR